MSILDVNILIVPSNLNDRSLFATRDTQPLSNVTFLCTGQSGPEAQLGNRKKFLCCWARRIVFFLLHLHVRKNIRGFVLVFNRDFLSQSGSITAIYILGTRTCNKLNRGSQTGCCHRNEGQRLISHTCARFEMQPKVYLGHSNSEQKFSSHLNA